MAEQERKTKAERREEKRQRRLEEEAQAAAEARRQSYRNAAIAVALVAVLGGLGWLAFDNVSGTGVDSQITVAAAEVEEAREAAECEVLDVREIESREHLDPATAPPAEVLYTQGRPTASGPHYANAGPVYGGVRDEQLDERATTHNLEHGSVIFWYDPEQVSDEDVEEMDRMVQRLNDAGFESTAGAGIFASPYTDPGIESGKAVAARAWGRAMDCAEWDIDYAYGWIAEHFGTRGTSPEAALGPYPEDVLAVTDGGGSAEDEDAEGEDAEDGGDASDTEDAGDGDAEATTEE